MDYMTKSDFQGSIFVTPHAIEKAMKVLNIKEYNDARIAVVDYLRKSTFISEIVGETGKVDRLFAFRRIAFVLDRTEDVVITIYERENVDRELREEVKEIITDYLHRMEKEDEQLREELLSLEMEHDMLVGFKQIMPIDEAELIWLRGAITQKQNEIDAFRAKRSKVAKGAVAFV